MTVMINGEVEGSDEEAPAPSTVAEVLHSALNLLASMPERPERLRVTAADVTVDLDWRPMLAPAPPSVSVPPSPAPSAAPAEIVQTGQSSAHFVCAPTVGTFYHAPEPGAGPFTSVGAPVDVGQQVGIVEAMKLMLPVEADRAGRVVEVLVGDGQPVEYGQRLLAIDPAG